MHADSAFDRELETMIHAALDAETGPHPVWANAPAAHRVATAGRRTRRWPMRVFGVAAVLVLGGSVVAGFVASRPAPPNAPHNGWIAFSDWDRPGIYLVREGTPARRVVERTGEGVVEGCPAFSPDGRRLAYGQASGDQDHGYSDASVVIADVTPDGEVLASTLIPLPGMTDIPCTTWSRDGRWIAFGMAGLRSKTSIETDTLRGAAAGESFAEEVWLVDTGSRAIRKLTGLAATDIEWSPTADELAIANGGILLYAVGTDRAEPIGEADEVLRVSWAPDGRRLVYERVVERPDLDYSACSTAGSCWKFGHELRIVSTDGSGPTTIASGYEEMHGIGPVWSPDGTRIAYQRVCKTYPSGDGPRSPCREQHEVVVVPVGASGIGPAADPLVIAPPQTDSPNGPAWWYPFSVTWSPDSTQLLYIAWGGAEHAILAVPADGAAPAAVLFSGSPEVYIATPWLRSESWARLIAE